MYLIFFDLGKTMNPFYNAHLKDIYAMDLLYLTANALIVGFCKSLSSYRAKGEYASIAI